MCRSEEAEANTTLINVAYKQSCTSHSTKANKRLSQNHEECSS